MKKVVSARLDPNDLAKAYDGLISKGITPREIDNISQLLRLTFYYGLLALCDDPKTPASHEGIIFINQRLSQKKSKVPVTLNDFIDSNEA